MSSSGRTGVLVLALVALVGSVLVGLLYSALGWFTSTPHDTEAIVLIWTTRLAVLISVPIPLVALLTARRVPLVSVIASIVTLLLALGFVALLPAMLFGLANP